MCFHYLSRDPEAHPEAFTLGALSDALEALKDSTEIFGRYSNSLISNGDRHPIAVHRRPDRNRFLHSVFESVRNQVGDHLIDSKPVPGALDPIGLELDGDRGRGI